MNSLKNNFINEIIDLLIDEVSKEDTKKKINTYIIEPSFTYVFDRLYPYLVLTLVIFVLILLMAIVIIIILIRNYRYSM
jgi:hypothetical protein